MPRHGRLQAASSDADNLQVPLSPDRPAAGPRKRHYARWRALSLSLVYVVFGLHIAHWKLTGRTLAPLELNEVMYTLELGIITAGFIFMVALVLGSFLFGRFFCSWACHIMVLQEACGWLLRKLGIRPKQVRSRLLLFVPPLTACYMFVWPQIVRFWYAKALPTFHLAGDADGWASFATTNFWRNLPGPWIMGLTFLVCGFAIVYVLGSRSFCTYVCPYGSVFGLADRFSPARIRVSDACKQCGTCTATCTSSVRVHDEVRDHGMIVNPACLKDLDCVAACPEGALSYGVGRPALFKSYTGGGRFGVPYDFSWPEEILAAATFLTTVLCLRGLYGRFPFLLSLACGIMAAYGAIVFLRLRSRPDVVYASAVLKRRGRVRPAGVAYVVAACLFTAFLAHSGLVRFQEYRGLRDVRLAQSYPNDANAEQSAELARRHLGAADRWGLFTNPNVERGLFSAAVVLGDVAAAELYAQRMLERRSSDPYTRIALARTFIAADRRADAERQVKIVIDEGDPDDPKQRSQLAAAHELIGAIDARHGQYADAAGHFRQAIDLQPESAARRAQLGAALAELGRVDEAIVEFEDALARDPTLHQARYNLGTLLMYVGRFEQALPHLDRAMDAYDKDPDAHNNLGLALLQAGSLASSEDHLHRAIELAPDHADAHFNLARVLDRTDRPDLALAHLNRAAALDARYAPLLERFAQ